MCTHAQPVTVTSCDICGSRAAEPMFEENGFTLNRCSQCGHFSVPCPSPDIRCSSIVEEQPSPDMHQSAELSRLPIFEKYVREVRKYTTGGRWLDIGCGCGTLLEVAQREGFHPIGIETDPQRLAFCRAKGLTVYGQQLGRDTFHPDSLDVISLINVFSHLSSPRTSFEIMARALRPGGLILVATSECGKTVYKDEVVSWHIPDHLHFAGPNTFRILASRLGLKLLYVTRDLSQKAILAEKLDYDSEQPLLQVLKLLLRHTPGLIRLMARMICMKRGYCNPRYEVVLILHKPSRQNVAQEPANG